MIKKIFLCGNTGSNNRGCEAIIQSTYDIIRDLNSDIPITLFTYNEKADKDAGLDKKMDIISYANYHNIVERGEAYFWNRVFKNYKLGQRHIQRPLFDRLDHETLCLFIGGDTYCCKNPMQFYGLQQEAQRKQAKTILWGCTVDKSMFNETMVENFKQFHKIVAREKRTYEDLISVGVESKNISLCPDTAFNLKTEKCELPDNFVTGNTLCINPVGNDEFLIGNYVPFIKKVLETTDMQICLVPHVFTDCDEDMRSAKLVYRSFENNNRVSIVDKKLHCKELKFIISQVRFLIAHRTHASIAGYSSLIPTHVIGYSVKSVNIAIDIFGRSENFVTSREEIKTSDDLVEILKFMLEKESEIKETLKHQIPLMKGKALETKNVLKEIGV